MYRKDILQQLKKERVFDYLLILNKINEKIKYDLLPKNIKQNRLIISLELKESFDEPINWDFFTGSDGENFLLFILNLIVLEINKDGEWLNIKYTINHLQIDGDDKRIDLSFIFEV